MTKKVLEPVIGIRIADNTTLPFIDINIAANLTGVTVSAIRRVVRGERKTAGGYEWSAGSASKPAKAKAKPVTSTVAAALAAPTVVLKNYVGLSRDHSGSMYSLASAAARDYNNTVKSIKEANAAEKQDTVVSVVKFGGYGITREATNLAINSVALLNERAYDCGGSTPLFDSVGDLIEQFESAPDAKDPNVSFLVMAITDGEENTSVRWNANTISAKIKALQATDRWTFVFRVPRGYKAALVRLGLPDGNILEWDQTTRGVEVASVATGEAFRSFYSARSKGATSTKSFYTTDLSKVSKATVKAKLIDISAEVSFFDIKQKEVIRPFIEKQTGKTLNAGEAFYQLTKKEDEVQDYKQIAIRDKKTKQVYSGQEARNILGLPHNGTVKVAPGNHGTYDIFIQSTSVNRSLLPGTQVMYWSGVGRS